MKAITSFLYSVVVCAALLCALWFLFPVAIKSPIISGCILIFLLITPLGAALRTISEVGMVYPILKIDEGLKHAAIPMAVFAVAIVAAIAIPWVRGIDGWEWKQWVVALMYTFFSFETFFALFNGLRTAKNG